MDRNTTATAAAALSLVALRKESVDRNSFTSGGGRPLQTGVALRKESVDRNGCADQFAVIIKLSLSARRAWIEMGNVRGCLFCVKVALRKESVDRNDTETCAFVS